MSDPRDILMAFKSSLDKLVGDLAEKLSLAAGGANPVFCFDLDDHDGMRQIQSGTEHALCYQYITLSPTPRHPLYECQFLVGAKTSNDSGNYDMTSLLTDVGDVFRPDAFFELFDWSVASADVSPTPAGVLIITDATPAPQLFENQSGIRLFQISGKVMADG